VPKQWRKCIMFAIHKLKNDPKNYKDMNLFSHRNLVIEIRKASFAPLSALETFRSVVRAAHTFQHDRYRWTLVPSSSMLMMILVLRTRIVAAAHLERSARSDNKRTIFYKRDRSPHSSCPESSRISSSSAISGSSSTRSLIEWESVSIISESMSGLDDAPEDSGDRKRYKAFQISNQHDILATKSDLSQR